jgi:hypothetical protein
MSLSRDSYLVLTRTLEYDYSEPESEFHWNVTDTMDTGYNLGGRLCSLRATTPGPGLLFCSLPASVPPADLEYAGLSMQYGRLLVVRLHLQGIKGLMREIEIYMTAAPVTGVIGLKLHH